MNVRGILPLFDRVLVKPELEQVSSAGIYVPRDNSERSRVMTVVCVGDGICGDGTRVDMVVKVDDRVIVAKYAGTEVVVGAEKLLIVKQCDILAKEVENV